MKKILTMFLILLLALPLCACELTDNLTESELGGGSEEQERLTTLEELALVYFEKGEHPLLDTSVANQKIHTVVYEPAFTFDERLNIIYGCAMDVQMSGTRITVSPDTGRHFSDGTRLSAELMAKSFRFVLKNPSSPYYRRLSVVESVTTQGGNLIINLKREDKGALYCMDIPVVHEKDGKYYGCGNYMIGKYRDEPALLTSHYAKTTPVEAPVVLLKPDSESALAAMFNSGVLDALPEDLMVAGQLSLSREYESVEYLTNTMLYVGINTRESTLGNAMRRALGALIPREDILASVLMGKGVATARPFYPYWSELPEEKLETADKNRIIELFTAAGLHSENGELFTASGERPDFEILVCESSKVQVATAEKIRSAATAVGMDITIEAVDEETFLNRLKNGNFELYIARYALSENIDPSPLYTDGSDYNYGGVSLPSLEKAHIQLSTGEITMSDFLTQFERECPILPIAFIKNSVYYTQGVEPGGNVSASNPLGQLEAWSVK